MRTLLAVLILAAALAPAGAGAADWQPNRPVEFVVASGAGGGTDIFARTVQSIIVKYNLLPQPIVVLNKGGGSGAEGFVYVKSATGDPHKLVFGTNNEWILPMAAKVAWKFEDLTPVAAMALDEFLLWVRPGAPWKTAADYVADAKKRPGEIKMGGSQSKDTDQLLTRLFEKATGIKLTYLPFKSGGEAAVQLAGGHIDSNTNNPAENVGQWKGGQATPLCVFSKMRLAAGAKVTATLGWSDIPLCKDQGVPIDEYKMPRDVFLPGGAPAGAAAYYAGVLKKVSEKPEWAEYITRTSQTANYMGPDELKAFIKLDEARARKIYEEEGWLVR
ncbi:MAG: tripartite tricarboxylate transporter substrate binding protein [Candidatus Methylomirabilales bacterium]